MKNNTEHLTAEEMIKFVSFKGLNEETKELASKVNSHILNCDVCLEKVRAFQMVSEAIQNLDANEIFSKECVDLECVLEKCAQQEEEENKEDN